MIKLSKEIQKALACLNKHGLVDYKQNEKILLKAFNQEFIKEVYVPQLKETKESMDIDDELSEIEDNKYQDNFFKN